MLELRNITKSFGDRHVLHEVTTRAERGEVLCIVGPNGSGKTTILKIIDLLDNPDSGELLLDGVDITRSTGNERTSLRRRMGMVFQQAVLYNASVYGNVALGLRIRGTGKSAIDAAVREALRVVNLLPQNESHAYTLSGGEAQRVCLARCLATRPEVMLLDEPTANLDPTNALIVEETVRVYAKSHRAIVIFTTHNMFEAKRLANRVALLVDGCVVEDASAEEFFTKSKNPMTSRFIRGEMALG